MNVTSPSPVMPSSPSRASPAQKASSSSLAATEPLMNVTSPSPEMPNSSDSLGTAASSDGMPVVRMSLLAFLSPIMSARLCIATGSATFARILTLQAAGWPACVHGAVLRSGGGLRETTPATSTVSMRRRRGTW